MIYAVLTKTNGIMTLPIIKVLQDKVIKEDATKTKLKLSDLTESELRLLGLASIHYQRPQGDYIIGEPSVELTTDGVIYTYPNAYLRQIQSEEVKVEAEARILKLLPEWKQRNKLARAVELIKKIASGETLTQSEQTEITDDLALWEKIKQIRKASNTIEALDPIPHNFRESSEWPEV